FFEEVMFDFPSIINAQTIRQLHLLQRFLKQLLLGVVCPRTWQLILIENAKLHAMSFHPAHEQACSCVAVLCPCRRSKSMAPWPPSNARMPEQSQRMSTAPPLLGLDAGLLRAQPRR